VFSYHFSSL